MNNNNQVVQNTNQPTNNASATQQMPNPNQQVQATQNNAKIKTDFSDKNKGKNIKLIRYKYKAKDKEGKLIDSYFDAENKTDVESFLLNKAYEIISIEEDKLSTSLGLTASSSGRMRLKDLNFFLMQLSTYVKSGIPLLDSMEILSRQAKNKNTQMTYHKIVFDLSIQVFD